MLPQPPPRSQPQPAQAQDAKASPGLGLPTECVQTLEGHTASVLVVRSNTAGTYCMSGSRDRTVRLWNPHRGTPINTYRGHSGDVRTLAIASDNSKFVSAGEDRHINVWDVTTASTIRRLHGHDAAVNEVVYAADESLLVSGSYDSTVAFWDLRGRSTKAVQTVKVASDAITAVAAAAAAPLVFAASTDGTVHTLDVRKGCIVTDAVHQPITSIAVPADAVYVLAACTDAKLRLLDRAKGKELGRYVGHQHGSFQVECALLCADAIAAAGSEDGCVVMWELVSRSVQARIEAHTGVVTSIAPLRKDGVQMLLTGGADRNVKMWRPPA